MDYPRQPNSNQDDMETSITTKAILSLGCDLFTNTLIPLLCFLASFLTTFYTYCTFEAYIWPLNSTKERCISYD